MRKTAQMTGMIVAAGLSQNAAASVSDIIEAEDDDALAIFGGAADVDDPDLVLLIVEEPAIEDDDIFLAQAGTVYGGSPDDQLKIERIPIYGGKPSQTQIERPSRTTVQPKLEPVKPSVPVRPGTILNTVPKKK